MTARLFPLLVLAASLLAGVPTRADDTPQLLIPGTFHADEVTAHSGERWLALVAAEDGYALEETVIRVAPATEQAAAGDKQVAVDGDRQPLLLVRGLPELTPGPVATVSSELRGLPVDRTIPLALPAMPGYALGVACVPAVPSSVDHFRDCSLVLSRGERTQQLADFQVYSPPDGQPAIASEARPALIWAGDLDRDGSLDLLLNLTDHYNVFAPALFLSSRAGTQELVGKAATFLAYGC